MLVNAFEEIPAKSRLCLHTGTLPGNFIQCQGFWSTTMIFLCLLLYYCAYMNHRIIERQKDHDMPAWAGLTKRVYFLHAVRNFFIATTVIVWV